MVSFLLEVACYITFSHLADAFIQSDLQLGLHYKRFHLLHKQSKERWLRMMANDYCSTLSHTVEQPIRAKLNIEPHCETANQSRAQHWAALWNSQSEQSSTLSHTVEQPIRAKLNIEPHCRTANQSKAQHYYSWPFQITVISYHFILVSNPRVVNGHVKPFLENLT